jgi:hypothetical protein
MRFYGSEKPVEGQEASTFVAESPSFEIAVE